MTEIYYKIRSGVRKTALRLMAATVIMAGGLVAFCAMAASPKDFTVVLDAGHGGKDIGATDNGAREKDINLAVALKVGELVKKKLKNTNVVFTRDDDTFVSLQGRADIANKAKADLFISIHTNSVDAKNKNRRTVAGASVYTQGPHKDDANMSVARRENSVIELENGYEQKYAGFDPSKVESYIIFEMSQKQNIAASNRFAKACQDNLVKIAGRKDRGVHQAGFWVLWATSMPAVLVELDFICNPESAKYMTSSQGVGKMAEAIFEAIKSFEQNFRYNQKAIARRGESKTDAQPVVEADMALAMEETEMAASAVIMRSAPQTEARDMSHANLEATRSQTRARSSYDGRRRRSAAARQKSISRDVAVADIALRSESDQLTAMAAVSPVEAAPAQEPAQKNNTSEGKGGKKVVKTNKEKQSKQPNQAKQVKTAKTPTRQALESRANQSKKDTKAWVEEINNRAKAKKGERQQADSKNADRQQASSSKSVEARQENSAQQEQQHAGSRRSLRSGSKSM